MTQIEVASILQQSNKVSEFSTGRSPNLLTRDPKPALIHHTQILGQIIQVQCGNDSTFAITQDKKLYGWGQNTGEENKINCLSIDSCLQVSSGVNHTYVLTEKGIVYAWGSASYGGLGIESEDDVDVQNPVIVETFKEATDLKLLEVLQVKCGETHAITLV